MIAQFSQGGGVQDALSPQKKFIDWLEFFGVITIQHYITFASSALLTFLFWSANRNLTMGLVQASEIENKLPTTQEYTNEESSKNK